MSIRLYMPIISKNNLFCYLVDTIKFEASKEMKNILAGFVEKIDIINMNNIPMRREWLPMQNKLPKLFDKHKICVMCEGNEEYKYLERLEELNI